MIAVVVAIIIIWAFAGMPALELKSKSIEINQFLWSVSPRFRLYIHTGEDLLRGLLETFAIAVIGTFIASICISICIFRSKYG